MTREREFNTAVTAWRNGQAYAECVAGATKADVETYRAAYIKRYDFGPQERLQNAADLGILPLIMALEDAELDLLAAAARERQRAIVRRSVEAETVLGRPLYK